MRGARRIVCVALLVLAGLLAANPGLSGAGARGRAAASVPCATSGLDVWLSDTGGGGAAGSFYYELELTNLSGHSCNLIGYPGVSAVSLAGGQIGRPARRELGQQAAVVVLGNGESARAVLRITDTGVYSTGVCHPVTAAGLRVYPPGSTRSRIAPFPFQSCSKGGPAVLSVRAVRAN